MPHRSPGRTLLTLALTLTVLLMTACGGSLKVVGSHALAEKGPEIKGFIVFPVSDMTHDAKVIDAALRASDVAAWLLDHTDQPVLGPLDYQLYQEPDDLRVAVSHTNLATAAGGRRRLDGWIAVWIQITENRATNVRDTVDMRKRGKKNQPVYRIHGVEATLRVEVQLRDGARGRELARVVLTDVDDPTHSRLKGDPRPAITRLIHKALRLALGEAEGRLAPKPLRRVVRRAGLLPSPVALAKFRTPKRPSLHETAAKRGEVDLQIAIMALWGRLAPELSVRQTYFATKFPGVLLLKGRAPLLPGDVIRAVAGVPVRDRYQLDRAMRRCAASPCEVLVQRKFKALKVPVRWAPLPMPTDEAD